MTVVPPRPALRLAAGVVLLVGVLAALAGLVGGHVRLLGVVVGLTAVAPAALGGPLRPEAGVAVHGQAVGVALLVAGAAMANGVLARVGPVGVVLPVVAVICGSLEVGAPLTVGLWVLVGGAVCLGVVRAVGVARPATPTPGAAAWRHAALTAGGAGLLAWAGISWAVPHGFWAVLTLCLVFRPVPGETWRAAWNRTLGTLSGAVLAGVIAVLMLGWAAAGDQRLQARYLTPVVVLAGAAAPRRLSARGRRRSGCAVRRRGGCRRRAGDGAARRRAADLTPPGPRRTAPARRRRPGARRAPSAR
jgi:Fusaric acid resistance protein-like